MTSRGFDVIQHHRARTRAAEARADMLEREREHLRRVLRLTLVVAVGTECEPLTLLRLIDVAACAEFDAANERERLARLLRETDPERIRSRSAA